MELEDTEEPFNKVILEELKSKRKFQKGKGYFKFLPSTVNPTHNKVPCCVIVFKRVSVDEMSKLWPQMKQTVLLVLKMCNEIFFPANTFYLHANQERTATIKKQKPAIGEKPGKAL